MFHLFGQCDSNREERKKIFKINPVLDNFLYFLKNASCITFIRFYVCEHSRGEKMAKKMFLPFLLNLIENRSTKKNKYNVVRNKNSQKSDCVVHYML